MFIEDSRKYTTKWYNKLFSALWCYSRFDKKNW